MIDLLKKKGGAAYFSICMLIFLFFVYSGNEGNALIDIPHIEVPVPPLYIAISISVFFALFVILLKQAKVDGLFFLLLVPILIHSLNSVYMGLSPKFYVYFGTSILSMCTYLITINMNDDIRYLEKTFVLFFTILVIQIIVEALLSGPAESIYLYKHDMRIPIGASNALSSKLIPFFAFLFCTSNSKKNKLLLFVVSFIAIALTRSRGGFIDLFFVLLILFLFQKGRGLFSICKILIMTAFIFALFYEFWNSDLGSLFFSKNDASVNSRLDLWEKGLNLFVEHPFLGNGFYYESLANNPHNVILDLLMRSGIIGLVVFCLLTILIYLSIKDNLVNKNIRGGAVALFALFFQGLVEIIFFTYIHEIIIWTFVGYLIKKNELVCTEKNYALYNKSIEKIQDEFFLHSRCTDGRISCLPASINIH